MKISTYIAQLRSIQNKYGDVEVEGPLGHEPKLELLTEHGRPITGSRRLIDNLADEIEESLERRAEREARA